MNREPHRQGADSLPRRTPAQRAGVVVVVRQRWWPVPSSVGRSSPAALSSVASWSSTRRLSWSDRRRRGLERGGGIRRHGFRCRCRSVIAVVAASTRSHDHGQYQPDRDDRRCRRTSPGHHTSWLHSIADPAMRHPTYVAQSSNSEGGNPPVLTGPQRVGSTTIRHLPWSAIAWRYSSQSGCSPEMLR